MVRARTIRLVVFIIRERAKGRMYAGVRSDLSGVIRKALETVERGSNQPRGLRRLRGIDSKSADGEQGEFEALGSIHLADEFVKI